MPLLTVAAFRAHHRGGGLYSEAVSQRLGAAIAFASHQLRLSPAVLTITGVVLGVGASWALIALAPTTTAGTLPALVLGLSVGLGWQVAYAFDCADGQLARATGRTSDAGARLDILCDVVTQVSLVAALAAVAVAHSPWAPAWLYAIFAGTWMVNLITSILASGPANASLLPARSAAVRMVKLSRDYGAVIAVCSVVIAVVPRWTVGFIAVVTAMNGLFLVASVAQAARRALAVPAPGEP